MTQLAGNEPLDTGADQRTSVMAITALVLGLICFIPGLSVLAIILGVSSLLIISRSQKRIRGTSLAVAGLVIGLIVSAFWISVVVGAAQILSILKTRYAEPTQRSLAALDTGDLAGARAMFSPAAAAGISDESLGEFRAAYSAELGHFREVPHSLLEVISAYRELRSVAGPYQGRNDVFTIPARFEKGTALLVLEEDPAPRSGPVGAPAQMKDLQIVTPRGTTIDLAVAPGASAPAAPSPGAPEGPTRSEPRETDPSSPGSTPPEPPTSGT